MRSAMLRDIYKDNLRMTGKLRDDSHKTKRIRKGNLVLIGILPLLAVLAYIFVDNFYFLEPALSRENTTIAKLPAEPQETVRQQDPALDSIAGNSLTPAQYNAFLNEVQAPLQKIFGLKVKKIVIDPGHGGGDLGAIGKLGSKEKDITLDIASKLYENLVKHMKYQVSMTRKTDITMSLEERVNFANDCGADLFISIHINSIPNKPLNIIETFYFGPHTDKDALLVAEEENKGSGYSMKDFKQIIQNIGDTLKTQESNSLALYIQQSLYRNIRKHNDNIRNWGIKTAPFVVLLGVNVPAVLAEVTCLSNRDEERKLLKEYYRGKIAQFLEEGIVSYLDEKI